MFKTSYFQKYYLLGKRRQMFCGQTQCCCSCWGVEGEFNSGETPHLGLRW